MNKTTNEKSVPHIPMRFENAIKAALETPPERKPKKKAKARKKAEQLLRPRAIERSIAFHFFFEPLGEAGFVHWLSQIVGLAFFWEHRLAGQSKEGQTRR